MAANPKPSESSSSQTQLLLEAIEAGDQEAFRRLFERYSPALRQAIAARMDRRLRQRVDPSDILQETEMEVFARMDEYLQRRPMPLEQWLHQTAVQCLAAAWRRHVQAIRRSVAREERLPDRSSMLLVKRLVKRPPSGVLEHEEMARRLESVLDQLSELDREILFLRAVEGISNDQAATRLGVSPAAARKRFTRALLRARQALEQFGEGLDFLGDRE